LNQSIFSDVATPYVSPADKYYNMHRKLLVKNINQKSDDDENTMKNF